MDQNKISSETKIENLIACYTHLLDNADFAGVGKLFQHGKITAVGIKAEAAKNVERLDRSLQLFPDGTPRAADFETGAEILNPLKCNRN